MAKTEAKKCAHPSCQCEARPNDKYCSQLCKDAGADEVEIACDCGHPPCAAGAQLLRSACNRFSNALGGATLIATATCFIAAERLSYRRQDTVIRGQHFVLTRRLGPP